MSDLKVGDCVRLKSGGPIMTIEDIGKYGAFMGIAPDGWPLSAKCQWFDEKRKIQEDVFPLTSLEFIK